MADNKPVVTETTIKKSPGRLGLWLAAAGLLIVVLFVSIRGVTNLGGGIRLVGMEPTGPISLRTNLTFVFSEDVVDQKDVGLTLDEELVKFTPPISGKFRWITRRGLRFLPEMPFLPSTLYKAEVNAGLIGDKQYLIGKRRVEFSTVRFKMTSTDVRFLPAPEDKGCILQARIRFNYHVSPVELRKALRLQLTGNKKELEYRLDPEENSLYFTITSEPIPIAEKEQEVLLVIPEGFQCFQGELGLEEEFTYRALVGAKKPLQIINSSLRVEGEKYWIEVQCSGEADPETVAGFIELHPEVDFRVEVERDRVLIKSDEFKTGVNYNLRIKSGLPSVNGLPLARDYSAVIALEDLEPGLNFNSAGHFLQSKGHLNLGLETVNVERVNLEITRIYANNLIAFLNQLNYSSGNFVYDSYLPNLGKRIESQTIEINGGKNEVVATPINLGLFLKEGTRGLFQVAAYNDDRRWMNERKYVVVTDLGIVGKMGKDDLLVWVNSLETLTPQARVRVSLVSRNNQILAVAETDAQGVARFNGLKERISEFEPLIILVEKGEDFSFVHLENQLISTTDFDVRGRVGLDEGYEAFTYLDRDIFRPGDRGNLVAVIRGPGVTLPPEFPVKLEIRQPDGEIFRELVSNTYDRGACEFRLDFPDYAQTGKYYGNILVGEEVIGRVSFKVEEFMPDRMKVTTTTDQKEYKTGEDCRIQVEGVNLFGPPAVGRRTKVSMLLEPTEFTVPAYRSYGFGDQERSFTARTEELGEGGLDANGQALFTYKFPADLAPAAKLRAVVQATVTEDGGRAVSAYHAVDLHAYETYIGMKPRNKSYCELGTPFPISYIIVDTKGKPLANRELTAEVYRINWNSIYRRDTSGRYRYVSEKEIKKVYEEKISSPADAGEETFSFTPHDYGRYQVVITDPQSNARASLSFYAGGWGYSSWSMENPDRIELDLEKNLYQVGDKAQLRIKSPFAGKALVTVEREQVYDYWIVDLPENTGVVSIPVQEGYKPNVYVAVHLIRAVNSEEKHAPARAFGVIPLMVDCSREKLGIKLHTAEVIRPNREMEVKVQVDNAGSEAYLTLAAVDEGICQLTDYFVPDPTGFFFGKRSLGLKSYDLYGLLLPEVEGMQTRSAPGGDADELEGVRKQNLNPVSLRRVKPVSLWSGMVTLDQNGNAMLKLKVPQFNGTLRLMAVAFDDYKFGSAEQKVIVRDSVVMTPTFPRFVAPTDSFTIPVSVFNGTGKPGNFRLRLTSEGPVTVKNNPQAQIALAAQEEKVVAFQLQAGRGMGKLRFQLEVEGNGATCRMEEELALRPPVSLTHEIQSGSITADKPLVFTLDDNWISGTADYTLALSPFPTLEFAGGLRFLLTYPHGCLEQTTSKLFPLLYFDHLISGVEEGEFTGNADYYITAGIEKLEAMQLREGSFAAWPGGRYSNEWGSIYTAHFLVEARKAGYVVSDRVYDRMISYVKKIARVNREERYYLQTKIYALYVLSLNGTPDLATMAFCRRSTPENLSNYSRAQLGAAYFYTGDRITADELLPKTFAVEVIPRETGGNYNSSVRSDAIILSVLADVDPINPNIYKLVNRLKSAAKDGAWGTTQENAFALMALGKILKEQDEHDYRGEVYLGSEKIADFDSTEDFVLRDQRLAAGKIYVKVSGGGECYYYIKASGLRKRLDLPEFDKGLRVTRDYLDRHGNPIDANTITQGDLIVARITIRPEQEDLENIALVDMLPAGLEIENPRLGSRAGIPWLKEVSLTPDYMDIRDDRLLLFMSLGKVKTYRFYYALRAVTCGEFILPSIKAECMYAPEISSFNSSGVLTVVRGE